MERRSSRYTARGRKKHGCRFTCSTILKCAEICSLTCLHQPHLHDVTLCMLCSSDIFIAVFACKQTRNYKKLSYWFVEGRLVRSLVRFHCKRTIVQKLLIRAAALIQHLHQQHFCSYISSNILLCFTAVQIFSLSGFNSAVQ